MCTVLAWEARQRSVKSIWQFLLALVLSQLLCSLFVPLQHGALLVGDLLPLLNTFSNTFLPQYEFHRFNTTHMETGPDPFLPSLPSPLLGKSYISTEKKCTHPVLIRPGKAKGSGKADPMEAPHMSLGEQNRTEQAGRRAGMLQRFIWLLFLAFDDTVSNRKYLISQVFCLMCCQWV